MLVRVFWKGQLSGERLNGYQVGQYVAVAVMTGLVTVQGQLVIVKVVACGGGFVSTCQDEMSHKAFLTRKLMRNRIPP